MYKLICFDLDGTLIDEIIFIWQAIHDAVDTPLEIRRKAMDDFFSKKITYAEWARHDVELWKQKDVTKERLKEIIAPLKLMPGALETIFELKKQGMKIAIISGSIDIALEHVFPNYEELFDEVYINKLIFNEDGTIKDLISTKFDLEHKATALKQIAERDGLSLNECVFIGDHDNDIHVAETAGLSIAFNSKSDKFSQICNHVIDEKDLRLILPLILNKL
jgi:phosphoserine phosphatase